MNRIIITIYLITSINIFSQSGWNYQNSGTNRSLNSVFFVNSETGYIAGDGGTILKTTNSGQNWFSQQSSLNLIQATIYFINTNTGYIGGQNGIGKTTNGGQNWFVVFLPPYDVFTIFFINEITGYAGGKNLFFAKTTDGGFNWSDMNPQTTDYITSIYFTNALTGYAVGGAIEDGTIIKTTNGGANWTRQNIGEPVILSSVYFINSATGYTAGAYIDSMHTFPAIILKTTNGGTNWVTQLIGQGYYALYTLYFNNELTGYAGGITRIIKTTNGGLNWYSQLSTEFHYVNSLCFTDINTGYAVSGESLIFKTTNGGEPIGIRRISNNIPKSFLLYQNYPNPFNSSTIIRFSISNNLLSFTNRFRVRIVIYDILGNEVSTIVNKHLDPAEYEVIWNCSNVSSGLFFYKIFIDDGSYIFTDTKKMILIK